MKRFVPLLIALLICALFLPACGSGIIETSEPASEETPTAQATEPAKKTEQQKPDPADDGVLRVLMVGNSFCYHYTDELYGMLKAAGIASEICNVYYSGCFVKQHWEWYLTNEFKYKFCIQNKSGRTEKNDTTLKYCLDARNWDVITLQQHFNPNGTADYETAMASCTPYVEKLINIFRKNYPMAKLYWHETWAYQVGYDRFEQQIPTLEAQTHQYEIIRDVSAALCADNALPMIPSGDAWQKARQDPVIGDTLCDRLKDGGDNYHDGDVGGGQYLLSCVWFEILTQKTCVGNSYRPGEYSLSEAKIAALQKAAHETIVEYSGACGVV